MNVRSKTFRQHFLYREGSEGMALKRGRRSKPLEGIKKVSEGVDPLEKTGSRRTKKVDLTPYEATEDKQDNPAVAKSYTAVKLTGSKGETYEVAIPSSYVRAIPKKWEWNDERYRVAELIAQGIPISQIPDQEGVHFKSKLTIYAWLEHPEFKSYVDGIIMETGWASRRERLQNLQILNQRLLNKVLGEMDAMKLTDKNVGSLLTAIQAGAKLIAQEKGEFIEESKVTQDMNVTGTVANVSAKLEDLMASKTAEEKQELEKEFNKVGDDIIRALTGSKD